MLEQSFVFMMMYSMRFQDCATGANA
jgi:hypothetical protein